MENRSELIVRINFLYYFVANLPLFIALAAFAGTLTWFYHHEVSSVLHTLAFFAVAEPAVMLCSYFYRPTQLRFAGAKLFVTVRKQEIEVINLRQSDIEIRQNLIQRGSTTCNIHLRSVRVDAYAQKNGTSILYGVSNYSSIREYISMNFLP